jgi:uncharacterized protein (TIGR00266 family)
MDCKLIGNVFQALEVTLAPREVFYAERGAMIYMDSGIEQDVQMNGTGLMGVLSTKFSGESLFLTKFTNMSNSSRKLTLSGQSGSLSHIKITPGQTLILRRGDYVGSNNKVNIDINFSINKFLTGSGFAFQKITVDSTVFFDCVDSLITRDLSPGEEIIVDENHIKALLGVDDSRISVQRNTNIIKNLVSGEGWLLTCITGPGKVFLSSVPSIAPRQQSI